MAARFTPNDSRVAACRRSATSSSQALDGLLLARRPHAPNPRTSMVTTAHPRRTEHASSSSKADRDHLITSLNEDLSREYQAVIAYVVYSQVLKGAEYVAIAKELELHA